MIFYFFLNNAINFTFLIKSFYYLTILSDYLNFKFKYHQIKQDDPKLILFFIYLKFNN
jgi:hypothetical protein